MKEQHSDEPQAKWTISYQRGVGYFFEELGPHRKVVSALEYLERLASNRGEMTVRDELSALENAVRTAQLYGGSVAARRMLDDLRSAVGIMVSSFESARKILRGLTVQKS